MRVRLPDSIRAEGLGAPLHLVAGILAAAFLLYQALLPLSHTRPYPDFWHFGADSHRISFEQPGGPHDMARYQGSKHPLFVVIGAPLHRVARAVYRRVVPEPLAENLALTFPVAVLGALNAGVALLLFRAAGFALGPALLLVALYAGSAAIVVFSAFPDSYICTTFFTNLFLLAWLRDRDLEHWRLLALLTALAGLAAPQQMLLTLVPIAALHAGGRLPVYAARAAKYGLTAVVLFALPFAAQLAIAMSGDVAGFVGHEATRWSSLDNLVDVQRWAAVLLVFMNIALVLSVPAETLETVELAGLIEHAGMWLNGVVVLTYGAIGRVWCGRPAGHAREMCLSLVAFFAVYVAFFVWWTPTEAFIYSAPLVMPLWLVLHAPWVDVQHRLEWRAAVAVAALVVAAHSAWTVATLPERDDYLRVRSKWEAPSVAVRPPMA